MYWQAGWDGILRNQSRKALPHTSFIRIPLITKHTLFDCFNPRAMGILLWFKSKMEPLWWTTSQSGLKWEVVAHKSQVNMIFNTLRPWQICRHIANDIFKCIYVTENVWLSRKISLRCVPRVRINNIPALLQKMTWCRPGDKPLSEPMKV